MQSGADKSNTPETNGKDTERVWRAGLVIIGDEILSGRTQDANLNYLARWLGTRGVRLAQVRVVADEYDEIGIAVRDMQGAYDYVFTTGGIGPTHDDITVDAISRALGVETVFHPEALALLESYYGREKLTERRKLMARAPAGSDLIYSKTTGAPGIRKDNIFILAGIPSIMRAMLEGLDDIIVGGQPVRARTVAAYRPESEVAELLDQAQDLFPDTSIGSYPFMKDGKIGANFVVRSPDAQMVDKACEHLLAALKAAGIEPIDGEI